MKKLWTFFKTKFLTKKFLTFCVIGLINTIINTVIYRGVIFLVDLLSGDIDITTYETGGFLYYLTIALATLLSFAIASLFSYYANAKYTYNQTKRDKKTFVEAVIAFVSRYIFTYLFTLLIDYLFILILKEPHSTLANLIASLVAIPPFFLLLGLVFKRTKARLEKQEEKNLE